MRLANDLPDTPSPEIKDGRPILLGDAPETSAVEVYSPIGGCFIMGASQ